MMIDLWETSSPAYSIPTPVDCLGSLSTADSLTWRFPSSEDASKPNEALAGPIARDNKEEDDLLNDYILRCRVGFHYDACRELAGNAVEEVNKEREEREKARKEAIRQLQQREEELRTGERRGVVGELGGYEEFYGEAEEVDGEVVEEDGEGEEVLTQEQLDAIEEETGMDVDQ
jgi:DNA-binding transcriptional MerR regulator